MNNLNKYVSWLKRKDLAKNTIQNYLQAIRLFGTKQLTTTNLRNYFQENLTNYQPSTLYTKIKALTVYAHYKKVKVRWNKVLKLVPKYQQKTFLTLTEQELKRLKLGRFEESDWVYQRNNLIIDFLTYTGIRVSELINIRFGDYHNRSLKVLGKGNKVRFVFLPDFLIRKLFNLYSTEYLFTNKQGRKLSRVLINQLIQQRARLADIQKVVSPHTFRRTFATRLNSKGCNLTTIQKLLGHSHITTTAQYIHNDYNTLYDDYSKLWKGQNSPYVD